VGYKIECCGQEQRLHSLHGRLILSVDYY
jgi:hypothetical protein